MTSIVSSEDCVKILKNYLKSSNGVKFISMEYKPISKNVEGFMGEHHKLIITYEDKGKKKSPVFFVKNKPIQNKASGEVTDGYGMYKKEIFMYDFLLKEFEKYGYDTSFAAKSYLSIPNQALIMEDITLNGFSITERGVDLTMDHLKCVLKSLSSFHAAGYAFERTKSKELNREFVLGEEYKEYLYECFHVQYIDQSMYGMNMWKCCMKTLDIFIDLLPQNDAYKEEFRKLIKNAEIGKVFAPNANLKIKKTCGHGDLWSNNTLFKYENNVPVKCCLVDFQLNRYFYPSLDVVLSIFGNTSAEFRRLHLEELYSFYHKSLSDILASYGYNIEDIYPLADFYDSIDLIKVEVLMQVLLVLNIVSLPRNKLDDFAEKESTVHEVFFDNTKLAVEAFQNNDMFRMKIIEIIYDLREAMIKRSRK